MGSRAKHTSYFTNEMIFLCALEGRAQWSTARLALLPSRVRSSMCTPITPVVSYLLHGLAGCSVSREIDHGAYKLARTSTLKKKKKKANKWYLRT